MLYFKLDVMKCVAKDNTHMRLAGCSDRDSLAIKDLLPEDDYGGMPVLDSHQLHMENVWCTVKDTHQMPSICLPVSWRDIRLARPLLRS